LFFSKKRKVPVAISLCSRGRDPSWALRHLVTIHWLFYHRPFGQFEAAGLVTPADRSAAGSYPAATRRYLPWSGNSGQMQTLAGHFLQANITQLFYRILFRKKIFFKKKGTQAF